MKAQRTLTAGLFALSFLSSSVLVAGCGDDGELDGATAQGVTSAVARDYATLAHASYADALSTAERLAGAVDALAASPDDAALVRARQAWLAARDAYGRTEVFRFYEGPVDGEGGPEARLNGWPIDEQVIDAVEGAPASGIVNMPDRFPVIDAVLLRAENERGGEKNITCGYHAIEFLLWGQDRSATGPGDRPATDFLVGPRATAANGDRRLAYLRAAAQLLVSDLRQVVTAWEPSTSGSYGATFADADEKVVVTRMLQGMAALAGIELARERLGNAYETQDQEEEHSCFSDSTTADLVANARGIQEVYLGTHGAFSGKGVTALVAAKDPALDAKARDATAAAVRALEAIPAPFDQAIQDAAVGRPRIKVAMDANKALTAVILEIANLYGARIFLQ